MKDFIHKTALLFGLASGIVVFGVWMSIVGNPHVVETIIGLFIAGIVWGVVWWTLRRL